MASMGLVYCQSDGRQRRRLCKLTPGYRDQHLGPTASFDRQCTGWSWCWRSSVTNCLLKYTRNTVGYDVMKFIGTSLQNIWFLELVYVVTMFTGFKGITHKHCSQFHNLFEGNNTVQANKLVCWHVVQTMDLNS